MFLSFIIALVALSISAIAAYYSIAGLAVIFSASVIPIIIMGIVLEIGKLSSVVWLHQHWKASPKMLKIYLIPAVLVLMLITSMGIYGFLSKAHLEQTSTLGDATVQLELIDQKIAREQARIKQSQSVLDQLDGAVDVLIKYNKISGKTGATNVRTKQREERNQLAVIINESEDKIGQLNITRSEYKTQQVEIEAEVGPIRYVAALIYGEEAASKKLDEAVRWMIIVIVSVFDPLAIVLVLAASSSFVWAREHKLKPVNDKLESELLKTASANFKAKELELLETQTALDELLNNPIETIKEVEVIKVDDTRIKELEKQLEVAQTDLRLALEAAELSIGDVTHLEEDQAEYKTKIADFEKEIACFRDRFHNERKAKEAALSKLEQLKTDLNNANALIAAGDDLSDKLGKSQEIIVDKLHEEIDNKQQEINGLISKLDLVTDRITQLTKSVDERDELIVNITKEVEELAAAEPTVIIDEKANNELIQAGVAEQRNKILVETTAAIAAKDSEIANLRAKLLAVSNQNV